MSWTTQNPLNIAPGGDGKQTGFTKLKNEFISIYTKLSAFISETTGHTHDGSTDGGKPISISNIVQNSGFTMGGVLNEVKGANIASASTVNLTTATGNLVHVTGTTTITSVTLGSGMRREVIFDGVLTLTHHTTNNNLPGGANIATAAGDRATYWSDGTSVYCTHYQKADGTAVIVNSVIIASSVEAIAGTDNTKMITPLRIRNALNATGTAPIYACRAWVNFNGTGTVAIRASGNVSSITDNGTGTYAVNFTTAMNDINYSHNLTSAFYSGTANSTGIVPVEQLASSSSFARTTTMFPFVTMNATWTVSDAYSISALFFD